MSSVRKRPDLVKVIREKYLDKDLFFRAASKSWTFEDQPIGAGSLNRVMAHLLDAPLQRVMNALEVLTLEGVHKARTEAQLYFRDNDKLSRDDSELRRFLRLMERPGTLPEIRTANEWAMKQWLWRVKRGMAQQDIEWQVAVIFWSMEHGTGKSFNVRKLLEPAEVFTRHLSVDDLGEKFSSQMLANTVIAFFDEFAGAEAANAADLKAILAGRPWDRRVMYSEGGFFSENRTSAIATSNLPPPHGYEDTTGARRMWSIHCDGTAISYDFERAKRFNTLDVGKIYASVGTDDPAPHNCMPEAVSRLMDKVREDRLRTKTSLESFLVEATEAAESDYKMPLKEFQIAYNRYCGETRQTVIRGSYKAISEKLEDLGQRVVRNNNRFYMKGRCLSTLEAQ